MHTATRLTWIALFWLLTITLGLGCMKAGGYGTAAPGYYEDGYGGDGGGYGGEYDEYAMDEDAAAYDFEYDDVEGEVLSPEGANLSSRGRSKHASVVGTRNEFKALEEAPPEPAPQAEPADSASPDVEAPEQPRDAQRQAATKRQVIYTARMQISVYNVDQALAQAEALPERFGGWLHQRQDNQLVLRIPAEHLKEAMAVLAELGVVDSRTLEALDVTGQYTDLESRIRVLVEMQAQLEALLKKAKDVEQALEIRKALDSITMELELARAHMRELAKSIAFSTLIVRIVNRGPAQELPSSNDPFPWVINLGVEATAYR